MAALLLIPLGNPSLNDYITLGSIISLKLIAQAIKNEVVAPVDPFFYDEVVQHKA